jgi:alkylated DNA nucleotide flippase Atl1
MLARTSYARAWIEGTVLSDGDRARPRGMPMSGRLLGGILHHAKAQRVIQFIHAGGVIGGLARLAAFQHDDRERGACGDLLG